jgi:hypothetical protein
MSNICRLPILHVVLSIIYELHHSTVLCKQNEGFQAKLNIMFIHKYHLFFPRWIKFLPLPMIKEGEGKFVFYKYSYFKCLFFILYSIAILCNNYRFTILYFSTCFIELSLVIFRLQSNNINIDLNDTNQHLIH